MDHAGRATMNVTVPFSHSTFIMSSETANPMQDNGAKSFFPRKTGIYENNMKIKRTLTGSELQPVRVLYLCVGVRIEIFRECEGM